jgi:hypothetical protein
MTLKLLIDECLSPVLAQDAKRAGHYLSTCIAHRGWSGLKDWQLIEHVVGEDFTLVTHNARDFRGANPASRRGLHGAQAIHAGLVCLVTALPMNLARQRDLFAIALAELAGVKDLVNQCLEVAEDADGAVDVVLYELPPDT